MFFIYLNVFNRLLIIRFAVLYWYIAILCSLTIIIDPLSRLLNIWKNERVSKKRSFHDLS